MTNIIEQNITSNGFYPSSGGINLRGTRYSSIGIGNYASATIEIELSLNGTDWFAPGTSFFSATANEVTNFELQTDQTPSRALKLRYSVTNATGSTNVDIKLFDNTDINKG